MLLSNVGYGQLVPLLAIMLTLDGAASATGTRGLLKQAGILGKVLLGDVGELLCLLHALPSLCPFLAAPDLLRPLDVQVVGPINATPFR